MKPDEKLFREMAALYIEQEAAALRLEMEDLPGWNTAALDKRVRRAVTRLRLRPYVRPAALVAACIAIILLIPQVMRQFPQASGGAEPMSSEAAHQVTPFAADMDMDEAAPEADGIAPRDAASADPATGGAENPVTAGPGLGGGNPTTAAGPEPAPQTDGSDTGGETSGFPDTGGGGPSTAIAYGSGSASVPITFALPPGYVEVGYEEDNGKSIYRLRTEEAVDVVMVLEAADSAPSLTLDTMILDGREVYYKYSNDYSQIIFEQDGVLYDLSCKGNLDALIILGEAIV